MTMQESEEISKSGDILKEFVRVMHDVIPVLDQMKSTIEESSSSIPKASVQLNNVSQATESATVEILNVLDAMSKKFDGIEQLLNEMVNQKAQLQTLGTTISERLKGIAGQSEMEKLWKEYFELTSDSTVLTKARQSLDEAKNDTMNIAMALQVQDITSQQIAGVVHLIESVRGQLAEVLANLDQNGAARKEIVSSLSGPKTFDVNAEFTRSPQRQNAADDIINQWNSTAGQIPQ